MLLSSAVAQLYRSKRQWRKFWLAWHLYVGLSLGLVFVLAGVTGSLLVFYVELDEMLNPALQISEAQSKQAPQSYEALLQALKARHPERAGAWRIELPRHDKAMFMARYYTAVEKQGLSFAPLIVWLNPYTAEVISSRFWGEFIMTWIYDLHYALLLDSTGKTMMGIIGIVLLLPLLTGLYLWWPKASKLKSALSIKARASRSRLLYDLHKINGVYGFLLLIILIISGVILELPAYFNPMIDRLSPLSKTPAYLSTPKPGLQRISLDLAADIARLSYPNASLRWIETPKDATASYRIRLYQSGEPSLRFPKTTVWLDQYSGSLIATYDPRMESTGDAFLNLLHPLHNGEIAGMPGRLLVCISGFIPAVLYITGFMRWQEKRKAKAKQTGSMRL
ncbi:MAG: PepSY domain-containing protein [Methylococcaceae bacterium]|jgi:uncharacterized iron-regulated membrane protein